MRLMPQSSARSLIVIFVSGFFKSRFFSDCSIARLVTCDMSAFLLYAGASVDWRTATLGYKSYHETQKRK